MADNIPDAFKNGTLFTDDRTYTFLKLPTSHAGQALEFLKSCHEENSTAFQTFMYDKDEITIMLPTSQFQAKFDAKDFPGHEEGTIQYRMITFDVVLATRDYTSQACPEFQFYSNTDWRILFLLLSFQHIERTAWSIGT